MTDPATNETVTVTDIEDVFSFKLEVHEYTDGGYTINTISEHSIRKCKPSDFEQFSGISEQDQSELDLYLGYCHCIDKPEEVVLITPESNDKSRSLNMEAQWCGLDENPSETCVEESLAKQFLDRSVVF